MNERIEFNELDHIAIDSSKTPRAEIVLHYYKGRNHKFSFMDDPDRKGFPYLMILSQLVIVHQIDNELLASVLHHYFEKCGVMKISTFEVIL